MEEWEIEAYEAMFGKYKKIVRMSTGEAFQVPVRDIVKHGVREQDLDQYPRWPEEEVINEQDVSR